MSTASARLEVRIQPESKSRIERAAALSNMPLSDFVRNVVEERAAEVLRKHQNSDTVVPSYLDDLIAALEASTQISSPRV